MWIWHLLLTFLHLSTLDMQTSASPAFHLHKFIIWFKRKKKKEARFQQDMNPPLVKRSSKWATKHISILMNFTSTLTADKALQREANLRFRTNPRTLFFSKKKVSGRILAKKRKGRDLEEMGRWIRGARGKSVNNITDQRLACFPALPQFPNYLHLLFPHPKNFFLCWVNKPPKIFGWKNIHSLEFPSFSRIFVLSSPWKKCFCGI